MFPYSKVDNREVDTHSSGYFARQGHNKVHSLPWRHPLFWGHRRMCHAAQGQTNPEQRGFLMGPRRGLSSGPGPVRNAG